MSENEFNPEDIDPQILSLAGIHDILRNLNEGQKLILHFKHIPPISGTKVQYDESFGIIGVHVKFTYDRETPMSNQPIQEEVDIYSRYKLDEIVGVSTFPNIKK
jgi:hypothetical protein